MLAGIAVFAGINIAAFALCGIDKSRARRHAYRIPEAVLLGLGFFGGALGMALGMLLFHHKTRRLKFTLLVPLFFLLQIFLLLWLHLHFFL